jgi:hypothetical protein
MEFIALPIGNAGTTINKNLDHFTAAISTARPRLEQARANKGVILVTRVTSKSA